MAYHGMGDVETAARYAMRSVALLDVLRDRVALARSENNLALVLMARGDTGGARLHLERALALSDETDLEFGGSHVLLTLCERSMLEARLGGAKGLAEQVLELGGRLGGRATQRQLMAGAVRTARVARTAEAVGADYRLAYSSRRARVIGRAEVLRGNATFGIFGDGKEVAQIAMAKTFRPGDWRAGYYRDQTFMWATRMSNGRQFFAQPYGNANVGADPPSGGPHTGDPFRTPMAARNRALSPSITT